MQLPRIALAMPKPCSPSAVCTIVTPAHRHFCFRLAQFGSVPARVRRRRRLGLLRWDRNYVHFVPHGVSKTRCHPDPLPSSQPRLRGGRSSAGPSHLLTHWRLCALPWGSVHLPQPKRLAHFFMAVCQQGGKKSNRQKSIVCFCEFLTEDGPILSLQIIYLSTVGMDADWQSILAVSFPPSLLHPHLSSAPPPPPQT